MSSLNLVFITSPCLTCKTSPHFILCTGVVLITDQDADTEDTISQCPDGYSNWLGELSLYSSHFVLLLYIESAMATALAVSVYWCK